MWYKRIYTHPFSPTAAAGEDSNGTWACVFTEEGAKAPLDISDLSTLTGRWIKLAVHTLSLQFYIVISQQNLHPSWRIEVHEGGVACYFSLSDYRHWSLICGISHHQINRLVKMMKEELFQKTHKKCKQGMNCKACLTMNHKDQERDWKGRTHNKGSVTESRESYRKERVSALSVNDTFCWINLHSFDSAIAFWMYHFKRGF